MATMVVHNDYDELLNPIQIVRFHNHVQIRLDCGTVYLTDAEFAILAQKVGESNV